MRPRNLIADALSGAAGGRPVRYNPELDRMAAQPLIMRVPKDVMANEHNVLVGLPRTAFAAGATLPMAIQAPRLMIVRDLVVEEVSLAEGVVGTQDYTLQAFNVESNALALLVGAPIGCFAPVARNRPTIDLPCGSGAQVTANWTNNSAVAGILAGALYID